MYKIVSPAVMLNFDYVVPIVRIQDMGNTKCSAGAGAHHFSVRTLQLVGAAPVLGSLSEDFQPELEMPSFK